MPSSACDWSSDVCSSDRSEEHTSELQSRSDLVCRLLLEKKKNTRELTTGGGGDAVKHKSLLLLGCQHLMRMTTLSARHTVGYAVRSGHTGPAVAETPDER